MARTGSGKTAAFVIPLLEKLRAREKNAGVRALIFSPTRELASQTCSVCKQLGKFLDLIFCLITGGAGMEKQFESLAAQPDVLVATPGRLMHHLIETGLSLKAVSLCIFDEADRLFEMGFATQLHEILRRLPPTRQTALFSATLPAALAEFTRAGLNEPTLIRLDTETKLSEQLKLQFLWVSKEAKAAVLVHILRDIVPQDQQVLVFAATRHHVEFLSKLIEHAEIKVAAVYGHLEMTARQDNIAQFRSRKVRVLVVTDVAARGLDIPLLDNVINFDFPARPKLFVHRAGRVARAGRSGLAYSLVSRDELPYMLDLFLFLGQPLLTALPPGVTTYDESTTYFGSLPQHTVDEVMESYRVVLEEAQLDGLIATCARAYKMYYKTRPAASGASATRAKEIPRPIPIHPAFASAVQAEHTAVRHFISQMHKRSSTVTIFEAIDRDNLMMAHKRFRDDQLINRDRLKKQQAKKRKVADSGEEPAGESEGCIQGGEGNSEKKDEDDEGDRIRGTQPKEIRTDIAAVDAPQKRRRAGTSSQRVDTSLGAATEVGLGKPRLSAAARKKQKLVAQKKAVYERSQATNSESNEDLEKIEKQSFRDSKYFLESMPKDGMAKAIVERGYAVNDDSKKIDSLVMDVTPDDEKGLVRKSMVRKWDKKKKRYVMERSGGDKAFGVMTVRNESGKKVDKKVKPGELYEKWKKKHKQSVNRSDTSASADVDTLFDVSSELGSRAAEVPSKGKRGRRRVGARGGGGGGGSRSSSRGSFISGRGSSCGKAKGTAGPARGRHRENSATTKAPDELKTPHAIKKSRQEKEKRMTYLKSKKKKTFKR
eukprot:gb/GEZN01001778.1/.p1 GENE.gb/GEZN01001778.1/~~gb/GEZN01001778.1/.p1  ORF type:complete len:927 (-),score=132.41 gb/GEZN01001778.1/:54-2531(-)